MNANDNDDFTPFMGSSLWSEFKNQKNTLFSKEKKLSFNFLMPQLSVRKSNAIIQEEEIRKFSQESSNMSKISSRMSLEVKKKNDFYVRNFGKRSQNFRNSLNLAKFKEDSLKKLNTLKSKMSFFSNYEDDIDEKIKNFPIMDKELKDYLINLTKKNLNITKENELLKNRLSVLNEERSIIEKSVLEKSDIKNENFEVNNENFLLVKNESYEVKNDNFEGKNTDSEVIELLFDSPPKIKKEHIKIKISEESSKKQSNEENCKKKGSARITFENSDNSSPLKNKQKQNFVYKRTTTLNQESPAMHTAKSVSYGNVNDCFRAHTLDDLENELKLPNMLRKCSINSTKSIYLETIKNAILEIQNLFNEESLNNEIMMQILSKCKNLSIKMNEQYISIQHSLLHKTLNKINSNNMPTLTYFNLLALRFLKYEFKDDGHVEYLVQIEDKILHKTWEFTVRYATLRLLIKIFNTFFYK